MRDRVQKLRENASVERAVSATAPLLTAQKHSNIS
jgi:hypothetical protein